MIESLIRWRDDFLGRGDAAITVPAMDGAFKPNRALDDAEVVYQGGELADLASDGVNVFVAVGREVIALPYGEYEKSQATRSIVEVESNITAIAAHRTGGIAIAQNRGVRIVSGSNAGHTLKSGKFGELGEITALQWIDSDNLLVCVGSSNEAATSWKHDLMNNGRSGRLYRWCCSDGSCVALAADLRWCFGAAVVSESVWLSESWAHRVVKIDSNAILPLVEGLPAYPSRLVPSMKGGAWVTCFAVRTQLVEFVLRETEYRRRMVQEIDPEYWVAPSLRSGVSFMEPMQAAHLKTMGVVKPWAPPKSYGLVVRLDGQGVVRSSLHSRFDGMHHGIVAVAECGEHLYLLSQGSMSVIRLLLSECEKENRQ